MTRVSKQKKHLASLDRKKHEESQVRLHDRIAFVVSLLVTGIPFSSAYLLFLINNIIPIGRSSFYNTQKIVVPTIIELAKESCKEAFDMMPNNSTVAIDGSWAHRRNARQCIVDAIDTKNHKIIDFVFISKNAYEKAIYRNVSSNLMEFEGLKCLLPRLKASSKVLKICRDDDVKIPNLMRDINWSIENKIDTGHRIKNYDTIFKKHNKYSGGKLNGLKKKVKSWLELCLEEDSDTETKLKKYMNSYYHFLGIHKFCNHSEGKGYVWKHRGDKVAQEGLWRLLLETSDIIVKYESGVTTNWNEAFHFIKSRLAPKEYHWEYSWEARVAAAILQFNHPYGWILDLIDRLRIVSVSGKALIMLKHYINKKIEISGKKISKSDMKKRDRKRRLVIKDEQKNSTSLNAHK